MNLREIVFNEKKKIFCVLLIAFFNVIFYKNVLIAQLYPDSYGYIDYSFKSLLHLDLASNRTFGYPLFIRICQYLFRGQFLNGVVILQIVISCVSFLYLYKAGSYILKNKKTALLLTVLYASSPAVIGWNTIISTESLAISGTVFFIYALTKYLENTSVKNGVIVILWAFCLVWIKPALIVYDGIFLVFLIMRFFTERHHIDKIHLLYLIAGVIFSFILFGVYSYFNYKAHGTFSLTPQGPQVTEYATGVDMVEYTIKAAMGESCSDLHMVEPEGYWSCYMIHSQERGILKEVWIDDDFKRNNIVEYEMQFEPGDEIEAFTGSNGTLGTMILKYQTREEMLEKMDHMENWVRVILE